MMNEEKKYIELELSKQEIATFTDAIFTGIFAYTITGNIKKAEQILDLYNNCIGVLE